jgi:murein L,D-transpeptidase YcbB/YkuD
MSVIAGTSEHPTPVMSDRIEYLVINPEWNLPPDVVRDQIAPAVLREGWAELERRKLRVLSSWSEDAEPVPPGRVDWNGVAAGNIRPHLEQIPGPWNVMGRVKFMFPNSRGIYLHDTPARHLFDREVRAFSLGCVRVSDALRLAKFLTRGDQEEELSGKLASDFRSVLALRNPVPVVLAYFTAYPAGDGVTFHPDIYRRDARALW